MSRFPYQSVAFSLEISTAPRAHSSSKDMKKRPLSFWPGGPEKKCWETVNAEWRNTVRERAKTDP